MEKVVQSAETFVKVNDVELCYDTFGDPADPAMVVINGLGSQMLGSEAMTYRSIAALEYFVVRFDNRDVGKSTKFETAEVPSVKALRAAMTTGAPISAPYTLKDMAQDTVGLLDALDIDRAHVVGFSMGGMIGQLLALHSPDRVQTLTAMMSAPGWGISWLPTSDVVEFMLATPPPDLEGYCEHSIQFARMYHGSKYPLDEAAVRAIVAEAFERSYYPVGRLRQLAASLTLGNWAEELTSVQVPTLVINGDADPLVPVAGGQALAAAIPGATLMIVEGMGHIVPEAEGPRLLETILQHAK